MSEFTNLSADLNAHQALGDNPNQDGITSAQLKVKWDKPVNDVKDFINDTLIPELEAQTAAAKLGAKVGGLPSNVQAFIDIVEVAGSGNVPPNDTITNAMLTSDIKIGSLASLNTTIKTSLVNAINELKGVIANDNTPSGIIRMWHGTIANIPQGNVLCDGTNGTPDLRNKFIMGAQDQATMNTTGGSNTKTLTTNELPAHTHTGSIASGGLHSHTMKLYSSGGSNGLLNSQGANTPTSVITGEVVQSGGLHSHTLTIDSTGTGASFDNRPAYYALAFIMRV